MRAQQCRQGLCCKTRDDNKRQQDHPTAGCPLRLRCDISQAHTADVFLTRTAQLTPTNQNENLQICIQQAVFKFVFPVCLVYLCDILSVADDGVLFLAH